MGIDPSLNATGYGVISAIGREIGLKTAGDIRPPRGKLLSERLEFIYRKLNELLSSQRPDVVVLESVFTHERYVSTAAMMGHARGVACLATEQHAVSLVEYPPARIKKALTGCGAASKEQVARMVTQWIGCYDQAWSLDATDALALAIAHAHMLSQPRLTMQKKLQRVRSLG